MKLILSAALATCLALTFAAISPAQPDKKDFSTKKVEPKRVSLSFRNKPWTEVMEWLSDQTGLPVVGSIPGGTFTFVPPAGKTYTLVEVIDILNDALESSRLIIVRRQDGYHLVPVDDASNPPRRSQPLVRVIRLPNLEPAHQTIVLRCTQALREDAKHRVDELDTPTEKK